MSRFGFYRLCGYVSVVLGIAGTISIYRPQFLFYGIGLAMLGFMLGVLNIILNAKYEYDAVKYPKGYLGMFFSSLPVVFFLVMIYRAR